MRKGTALADIYGYEAQSIDGRAVKLADWRGKVLLIVNTASKCGFTPQYEGLEDLHTRYGPRGFAVLGFPCNQFAGPGAGRRGGEIAQVLLAELRRSASRCSPRLPSTAPTAHPLLDGTQGGRAGDCSGRRAVKWNFTKFLIDRAGHVVERFGPSTKPEALAPKIEALL